VYRPEALGVCKPAVTLPDRVFGYLASRASSHLSSYRNRMAHNRAFHQLDPRGALNRLVSGVATGVVTALVLPAHLGWLTRLLAGWSVAASTLVLLIWVVILGSSAKETQRRAAAFDPGQRVGRILVVMCSLAALFGALALARKASAPPEYAAQMAAWSLWTVAAGWTLLHSIETLRYAHLYYGRSTVGGLSFPGDEPPADLDFAYFAFTVGMCFQVSDVAVTRAEFRWAVLRHAMISFVFNTGILAFVLNLVVGRLG
jgi:uncharacterized membrane protein